ncbi:helix-turn-helix domain-containing protein [Lentzea sp. CA-135723]|uniref:helix-turn-helix domain-containing protein n=1 Tax=Lentzea sp. CA-135723 TaxID=3239950 RepID=UPI003D8A6896
MAGRPQGAVVLTDEERAALRAWTRSRTCAQALAQRAQIVLACESEPTNADVARLLGVSRDMVGKWRSRFLADRLAGLAEQPRAGRPPAADDDTVAHVLIRTLTPPPHGQARWTTRSTAAETGLSQSTVNRIWRTFHIGRSQPGSRRPWSLPDNVEEVVGLYVAPPVCVLAVTTGTGPVTTSRLFGHDDEPAHVLAVACAFARLRGTAPPPSFLDGVATGPKVRLLVCGTSAPGGPHWHYAPDARAWVEEVHRLLAGAHSPAPGPSRLRDALLTWSTTWTPAARPFALAAAPGASYSAPISGRDSDSPAPAARTVRPSAAELTTDPLVERLRETLLAGPLVAGERVREAPLATGLGCSRRAVRTALRALAEEGLLDLLPTGAARIPVVTAQDVLDVYALRASLGALLLRRVAMFGPEVLAPAAAMLDEVRAAAHDRDHHRIRAVDLWFQDALARTADLPQAAGTFERSTARLWMFVNLLDMDYRQAFDVITAEDAAVFEALQRSDGNEAARLWRLKIERCVRHMVAQFPSDDVDPHLWTALAGRPRLHRT